MLVLGIGLMAFPLLGMMVQDYRHRAISITFLAIFSLGCLLLGYQQSSLMNWLENSLISVSFLGFFVVLIQLYYKLRFREKGWFIDRVIGIIL